MRPARNISLWETISASFGSSRRMGMKYRVRRMENPSGNQGRAPFYAMPALTQAWWYKLNATFIVTIPGFINLVRARICGYLPVNQKRAACRVRMSQVWGGRIAVCQLANEHPDKHRNRCIQEWTTDRGRKPPFLLQRVGSIVGSIWPSFQLWRQRARNESWVPNRGLSSPGFTPLRRAPGGPRLE